MSRAPHTGVTEKVWSRWPWVSRTATGRSRCSSQHLVELVEHLDAGVDHDALLARAGGHDVAVRAEGGGGEAGDQHERLSRRWSGGSARRRMRAYRRLRGPREPVNPRLADRARGPTAARDRQGRAGGTVAGSAKRERQLAREHYERQQARRAARAAKQRRSQAADRRWRSRSSCSLRPSGCSTTRSAATTTATTTNPQASPTATASDVRRPRLPRRPPPEPAAPTRRRGEASKDVGLPAYDVAKAASYRKPFTATLQDRPGRHRHRHGRRQGAVHHEQLPAPRGREVLRRHLLPPAHHRQHLRAAVR